MGATCQPSGLRATAPFPASCAHEARQVECGEPAYPVRGCAHACRVCRQVVHTGATGAAYASIRSPHTYGHGVGNCNSGENGTFSEELQLPEPKHARPSSLSRSPPLSAPVFASGVGHLDSGENVSFSEELRLPGPAHALSYFWERWEIWIVSGIVSVVVSLVVALSVLRAFSVVAWGTAL